MVPFAHLHVHSEYSLLDGACRLKGLVDRASALGQTSVALTDHGVMYGVIDFYRECKAKGIHPVIGCEVYMAPHSRFDRGYIKGESHSHLILLCENQTGYKNLIHMVSLAFSEGFYKKPRIDMELLSQHSEGLICLSACLAGAIPRAIANGDMEKARGLCNKFLDIFDRDHFYLEVQDHGIELQKTVNEGLFRLAEELDIGFVATNDAHYLTREDSKLQDVLLAIQTGKTVSDTNRMRFETQEFYIKDGDEMAMLFPGHPEALENTVKIAERCNVEFEFGNYHLPEFKVPDGYTALEYMTKLCKEGFSKRYPNDDGKVWNRLQYEINMISEMGFVEYFLIVADFIVYAKKQGIPVGPGRGSAAGSVVAYCMEITDIDPIRYSLYFERFLNPERVSMPDIDVDFCYVRRQEVIDYVTQKYGRDCVVQIVTFGTMAAKNAIRDVGRALDMPYKEVNAVSKMIPEELHMTIDKALDVNSKFRDLYENSPKVHELVNTARGLEGMPRHTSTHAAGVVITKNPVDTYVPLSRNDDQMVAQFNMVTLEELGLLKMDFLGLRTLTVIADAEKMIQKHTPDFSINTIDLDDKATYDMLGRGLTKGVFQLESSGITGVVTGLQPQSIEDITAIVALYRPGPMQSIPRYIESKHNPEKITYKHPLLEPILKVTYGCMIYQEQVMQVFQSLAGYSLGKADMVRRAMSKKKMKELAKERVTFIHGNEEQGIDGAVKRGVPENVANELFDEIMEFANYAFNKAHAVSYAVISYRTAYLKCHYPHEFMAALITSVLDSSEKASDYIQSVKEMGIEILPPDVNISNDSFSVSDGVIRYGLAAIKNVGRAFVKKLMEERNTNGSFVSFYDFCERMSKHDLNRRTVESLVKAGAFDSFGILRSQLIVASGKVLESVVKKNKKNIEGQLDLFNMDGSTVQDIPVVWPDIPELSEADKLAMEKEVAGQYLTGHPMYAYHNLSQKAKADSISKILQDVSGESVNPVYSDGMSVRLSCIVSSCQHILTKKGKDMAFATVEDESGAIETVVFSRQLHEYGSLLSEGKVLILMGTIDAKENEKPKIMLEEAMPLDESSVTAVLVRDEPEIPVSTMIKTAQESKEKIYLRVPSMSSSVVNKVMELISEHRGDVPVVFCPAGTKKKLIVPKHLWCQSDEGTVGLLIGVVGIENICVKSRK